MKTMKPWQAPSNKHAAKGVTKSKERERERGPKSEPEKAKPKVGHKGARMERKKPCR
jgi:hypothetical protein